MPDRRAPNPSPHNQWYPFLDRPVPAGNGQAANTAVVPVHDVDPLPQKARFIVVGAGIHGLSTAWHLAMALEQTGRGRGSDVVLIDKQGPGAGATGLACGCVRNFYMTEPLHAILRESIAVWESDPVNFGFQQVSYVSVGEANQEADYVRIHKSQNDSGYPSDLYVGAEAKAFLKAIWPDFRTGPAEVVLHEKPSGYAGTHTACWGLDQKCRQWGVRRCYGPAVTGYDKTGGTVTSVRTDTGDIAVDEAVVLATGAWMPEHWTMLGLPPTLDVSGADGSTRTGVDMWTFWRLLEGEVYLPEGIDFRTADRRDSPVLHVEYMDVPVIGQDGKPITDHLYTYLRYAAERVGAPGIQGGTIPIKLGPEAEVEPYGHLNDRYQADDWFADYFCASLGVLMARFDGIRPYFKTRRNGGIGAFTPDNVPVFDWIADNVWMNADSNHGFKMIGVGKLVARELVGDGLPAELKPFRFDRYAKGTAYGAGTTNSPWV